MDASTTSRAIARMTATVALGFTTACNPGTGQPLQPETSGDLSAPTTDAEELAAFARLYGYVRYFHPSDAAAAADWNALAVTGARAVQAASDRASLLAALQGFVEPVGVGVEIYPEGSPPAARALAGEGPMVAWQHLGYGGDRSPAYHSARTHRSEARPAAEPGWARVSASLDAAPLQGKTLRLEARVRAEGRGGARLWLRVDRPGGELGFFGDTGDHPIQSEEWDTYVLEGPVAEDATEVMFGGFVGGYANAYFDDFSLAVVEGDQARPLELHNPSFDAALDGWKATETSYTYEVVREDDNAVLRASPVYEQSSELLFEGTPEPGEILDLELAAGLRVRLPVSLPDRLAASELPPAPTLDEELDQFEALDDPAVRAAAVVCAWSLLQHFFPYFDVIGEDWDAVLDRTLVDLLDDQGPNELLATLQRMIAKLHDGHGFVLGGPTRAVIPASFARIEGRVIVVQAREDEGLAVGDELLAIDGVPIEEALAEGASRSSGSPQWIEVRLLRWAGVSAGPEGETVELTVRSSEDEPERTVELVRGRVGPEGLSPPDHESIEIYDDGVVYVDLTRASWAEISAQLPVLAKAPGVVFDLRGYPNGNHEILAHLLREPDTALWMHVPEFIYPDQRELAGWNSEGWEMQPAEPHIAGKVAFLTDARAISYAESVMGLVEGHALGEIIGAPTAGANGNINQVGLPGGLKLIFTGMKVTRFDGRQHHMLGVEPTIPAEATIAGIKAGRDEVLEQGLAVVRGDRSK